MKMAAVQGYTVALSFLNMYADDGNKMDEIHRQLRFELTKIVTVYAKKHNIRKWIDNAWDRFLEITNNDSTTVDTLSFSIQMVLKNPNISKNKILQKKALEANKMFLFKQEDTIKNAKMIVNKFYNRGEI
jgi:hypothetical protein